MESMTETISRFLERWNDALAPLPAPVRQALNDYVSAVRDGYSCTEPACRGCAINRNRILKRARTLTKTILEASK